MAYLKRGPWVDGDQIDDADLTAMDDAIAAAQHTAHLDLGSVSGTILIDAATYGSVSLRLTGDATLAVTGLSPDGAVGYLDVYVNRDGHTLTWPTGTVWPGSAPSLIGNPDHVRLIGVGSTVFARHVTRYRYNESGLPAVGAAFMGGFYVGIMDTIATSPKSGDQSQRRIRYALIVSPRSMQFDGEVISYFGSSEWDGERASRNNSIASVLPLPSDGGSRWYIPALKELVLIYWAFKPQNVENSISSDVVGQVGLGMNEYADPPLPEFSRSNPAQTSLAAFRQGGAQYIGSATLMSYGVVTSTGPYSNSYLMGFLTTDLIAGSGRTGASTVPVNSPDGYTAAWRPVRRLILAEAA